MQHAVKGSHTKQNHDHSVWILKLEEGIITMVSELQNFKKFLTDMLFMISDFKRLTILG